MREVVFFTRPDGETLRVMVDSISCWEPDVERKGFTRIMIAGIPHVIALSCASADATLRPYLNK